MAASLYVLLQTSKTLEDIYPSITSVFGIKIYATKGVPLEKIEHAKIIFLEYLDNNEDGIPDNVSVLNALIEKKAALIISRNEKESTRIMLTNILLFASHKNVQDLYASEIHPNGITQGVFDASYEEILHLITQYGYASVYPSIFGETPNSKIAHLMDKARGGHYESIPKKYPDFAWYTYLKVASGNDESSFGDWVTDEFLGIKDKRAEEGYIGGAYPEFDTIYETGDFQYDGNVLTSGLTASTAEYFTLAMKTQEHVKTVGEKTMGIYAGSNYVTLQQGRGKCVTRLSIQDIELFQMRIFL